MLKLLNKLKLKDWLLLSISFVLIVISVFIDLQIPDYMKEITTILASTSELKDIIITGLKMLGCCLGGTILTIISGYISAYVSSDLSYNIREELFNKVIDLDVLKTNEFETSSLITRTTNDITQIQMFMSMGLTMLIKAPVLAILAITKIIDKSLELSLITLAAVILILGIIITVMILVLPRFKKVQKLTDSVNKVARENLTGIKVVRAFNAEEYEIDKFANVNEELVNTQLFNRTCFSFFNPSLTLIMSTLSLVIYWVGAYLINSALPADKLNLFSDIIVFSSYAVYVIQAFMFLAIIFMMLPSAQISANRINEVLKSKNRVEEGNITHCAKKGTIEFKNVSYHYGDGEDVLSDINFVVNKGETLAIIGPTGSGKSTIANLMTRLYDPTKGEILLNDINLKDYKFSSLYKKIAYVQQKNILFYDTIYNNIKLGNNQLTKDNLNNALEISQSKEFVNKLENKENFMLAEGGHNLSGGQKQRISIARGISRDSEIIIFDDSFSALDYKTDKLVREELNKKLSEVTKIIIAQRIGTIKNADKIIVIDEGKIVGFGNHIELLNNCSLYKEIALSQLSSEELMKGGLPSE